MMSLAEYEELLADMIARDKLTLEQAQQLRTMFINGDIREDDLPLPLEQAREKDETRAFYWFPFFNSNVRQSLAYRKLIRLSIIQNNEAYLVDRASLLHDKTYTVKQWHEEVAEILQSAMMRLSEV